jgi:glutathione S-transferase
MPILYEFALSPYVQKVKIALREKGIDFDRRNGFDPAQAADFAQGNPRREVPLLVDDDARIWDSTVILDYVDERWPEPPLLPADPAARAQARLLEELADTRLEALNFCIAEVMTFPVDEDAAAAAVVAASKAEIARQHDALVARLGDADYFGGAAPNRADIALLPHVNASRVMKNGPDGGPLADWLGRMNARPSVAATVREIKEALREFKELIGRVQRGEDKRQVRDHRLDWLVSAGGLPILAKRLEADSIRFSDA